MRWWCLGVVVLSSLACASPVEVPSEAPAATPSPGSKLKPASQLKAGCHGQPGEAWSRRNHADLGLFLEAGDAMTDFTLEDLDGRSVTLSDLLDDRPVLLLTGSYTCPEYRGKRPMADRLAKKFGGQVHVVAVHGPEAHPRTDPSPYKGVPKPHEYSDIEQPTSFAERVSAAKKVGDAPGLTVLVEPLDNPVWCTVGTVPNGALLIDRDGTIVAAHEWFDPQTMVGSVRALVGR